MIVLDTHALYWLATDDEKLGVASRAQVARGMETDRVAVSAISYWELAMLLKRGRIEAGDIEQMRRIASESGIVELSLDGTTAILAARLTVFHKDPADRFIAATALRHGATLMTADERLLAGPPELVLLDARK